jgi:hypothetical protein
MLFKTLGFTSALVIVCFTACGYRPAYGTDAHSGYSVTASTFRTPSLDAVEATLSGVRAGLSQAGSLTPGDSFPTVVVELLRVDEVPVGLAATGSGEPSPLARGSAVGVVARAWVLREAGSLPIRDTGDMRRVEYVAQGAASAGAGFGYATAVRGAARKVGEALARRILGEVEPTDDPL